MATPSLTRNEQIFVLDFGDDENVTSDAWVSAMHDLLDEVEQAEGPRALVTTASSAKHYSNGLDTEWMATVAGREVAAYVGRVLALVQRLTLFPVPTVAAVNGHAFGMGAFLSIAHDRSVMREDRGYLCFPEVHLGMTFNDALLEVVRASLEPRVMRQALSTGHRYSGPEAAAQHIVDAAAPLDELVERASAFGAGLASTAGPVLGTIKRQLMPEIAARYDAAS